MSQQQYPTAQQLNGSPSPSMQSMDLEADDDHKNPSQHATYNPTTDSRRHSPPPSLRQQLPAPSAEEKCPFADGVDSLHRDYVQAQVLPLLRSEAYEDPGAVALRTSDLIRTTQTAIADVGRLTHIVEVAAVLDPPEVPSDGAIVDARRKAEDVGLDLQRALDDRETLDDIDDERDTLMKDQNTAKENEDAASSQLQKDVAAVEAARAQLQKSAEKAAATKKWKDAATAAKVKYEAKLKEVNTRRTEALHHCLGHEDTAELVGKMEAAQNRTSALQQRQRNAPTVRRACSHLRAKLQDYHADKKVYASLLRGCHSTHSPDEARKTAVSIINHCIVHVQRFQRAIRALRTAVHTVGNVGSAADNAVGASGPTMTSTSTSTPMTPPPASTPPYVQRGLDAAQRGRDACARMGVATSEAQRRMFNDPAWQQRMAQYGANLQQVHARAQRVHVAPPPSPPSSPVRRLSAGVRRLSTEPNPKNSKDSQSRLDAKNSNKEQPGDWVCPRCTFQLEGYELTCFVCGTAAPVRIKLEAQSMAQKEAVRRGQQQIRGQSAFAVATGNSNNGNSGQRGASNNSRSRPAVVDPGREQQRFVQEQQRRIDDVQSGMNRPEAPRCQPPSVDDDYTMVQMPQSIPPPWTTRNAHLRRVTAPQTDSEAMDLHPSTDSPFARWGWRINGYGPFCKILTIRKRRNPELDRLYEYGPNDPSPLDISRYAPRGQHHPKTNRRLEPSFVRGQYPVGNHHEGLDMRNFMTATMGSLHDRMVAAMKALNLDLPRKGDPIQNRRADDTYYDWTAHITDNTPPFRRDIGFHFESEVIRPFFERKNRRLTDRCTGLYITARVGNTEIEMLAPWTSIVAGLNARLVSPFEEHRSCSECWNQICFEPDLGPLRVRFNFGLALSHVGYHTEALRFEISKLAVIIGGGRLLRQCPNKTTKKCEAANAAFNQYVTWYESVVPVPASYDPSTFNPSQRDRNNAAPSTAYPKSGSYNSCYRIHRE